MNDDGDLPRSGYGCFCLYDGGVITKNAKEHQTMKKFILYTIVIGSLVIGTAAAFAQMPEGQQGGQMGHGQMPTVDQRMQRLTQALNLTEDQQAKIKPIVENESSQMQSLRSDTSLSQEDRMGKMKQIRENTASQINPILTPDQQKQYAEMMSRMGHGRGGPGGPPPSPQQ
jgi:periplasmic protein CpxP/Spy